MKLKKRKPEKPPSTVVGYPQCQPVKDRGDPADFEQSPPDFTTGPANP